MAWPYLAPPGVPADRVAALRKAFMDTLQDKDFVAEAEKAKLEVTPVDGAAIQALVQEIYATPPAIVQKTAGLLQ
jgi:tripartite-type tricarboxylate transporter receptor subunit TctC